MFKNLPHVKHLLNFSSLDIMLSSVLFLILNKFLRKPVLVIKFLFYLFWHWFITLSYKLQELSSQEIRNSSMFLQSCRWKWKETSTRDLF